MYAAGEGGEAHEDGIFDRLDGGGEGRREDDVFARRGELAVLGGALQEVGGDRERREEVRDVGGAGDDAAGQERERLDVRGHELL